ncbi:ribonuclease H-like protein [Rickenella mellea]|uniref:RNA exonuclease 4 n=1 Tax=Rickenella mellea TaxID=50990 RepID=A0A4Y7Q5K4_9AGAM|nr:ribonuclease H-like protein [Rickenella mellea]
MLPSANWLALQKKIAKPLVGGSLSKQAGRASGSKVKVKGEVDDERSRRSSGNEPEPPRKKRRLGGEGEGEGRMSTGNRSKETGGGASGNDVEFPRGHVEAVKSGGKEAPAEGDVEDGKVAATHGGESIERLRRMVKGELTFTDAQMQPGRYVALDCEMVGIGLDGSESALARVSAVNFHGAVLLDAFVRPKERVVDYRTQWSGVREKDMVNAKTFEEVQTRVAELLKDRILVGHAVYNDLKSLLLSRPRTHIRDTQQLAGKNKLMPSRYPALRRLVQQELDLEIQSGEHSSVTDARATMALYRLHRKEWDKDWRPPPIAHTTGTSKKRKRASQDIDGGVSSDDSDNDEPNSSSHTKPNAKSSAKMRNEKVFPGGGRKGVSSGLSTILRKPGDRAKVKADRRERGGSGASKEKWWKTLGGTTAGSGAKGSMRLKA